MVAAIDLPEHPDELQGLFVIDTIVNAVGIFVAYKDTPVAQDSKVL